MISHRVTVNWVGQGAAAIGATIEVSADGEKNADVTLTASEVDKQVLLAFKYTGLKLFFAYADFNTKLETNQGATPGNTITLAGGVPYIWSENTGGANPFTVDVTKLFFTALTANATSVKIRLLEDVTP